MKKFCLSLTLFVLAALGALPSAGQGTAFSYQGQLDISGSPATGVYQMQFALYANSTSGIATAGPVTNTAVAATNGIFTTTIDFGSGVFTGGTNWLDVAVRTNLPAAFTELTPRQQILPVPYAIYAVNASNAVNAVNAQSATTAGTAGSATTAGTAAIADSVAAGAINGSAIDAGTLTASDFAAGQVVTNFNGLTGGVILAVTNNLSLSTNGNTVTIGGGNDFLCAAYTNQTQTVGAGASIAINSLVTNGWHYATGGTYGPSNPLFVVPATGYYFVHIEALPSSATPEIGAYAGATTSTLNLVPGSLSVGSPISHSFVMLLTAGEYFGIANAASGAQLQFSSTYSLASLFSFTVIRIN